MTDLLLKRCTRCQQEFPATSEYFHIDHSKRDGLYPRCRLCRLVPKKPRKTAEEIRARKNEQRHRRELENPEAYQALLLKKREAQRERRRKDPQKYIDMMTDYRKKHPDWVKQMSRVSSASRRARKLNAEGKFTQADIDTQYRSQKGKCWWCSKRLNGEYQVDHLKPLARGGTNWPENIVLSCEHCNKSRSDKLPHEWTDRLL